MTRKQTAKRISRPPLWWSVFMCVILLFSNFLQAETVPINLGAQLIITDDAEISGTENIILASSAPADEIYVVGDVTFFGKSEVNATLIETKHQPIKQVAPQKYHNDAAAADNEIEKKSFVAVFEPLSYFQNDASVIIMIFGGNGVLRSAFEYLKELGKAISKVFLSLLCLFIIFQIRIFFWDACSVSFSFSEIHPIRPPPLVKC